MNILNLVVISVVAMVSVDGAGFRNGLWCPWAQWNFEPCPKTCGTAQKIGYRSRKCECPSKGEEGNNCTGSQNSKTLKTCYPNVCPIHGNWTNWSSWKSPGSCSTTCGKGRKYTIRLRNCTNPRPSYGGEDCQGLVIQKKSLPCNIRDCGVNGGWSEWSCWNDYGACSKSCGSGIHMRFRNRTCNKPVPSSGWKSCVGIATEYVSALCNNHTCPIIINGGWSKWSEWSSRGTCPKTCGSGALAIIKTRTCSNPYPEGEGKKCSGPDFSVYAWACNTRGCPVNGSWTEWTYMISVSPCLCYTQGRGWQRKKRIRYCLNPKPANGGENCEGPNEEFITNADCKC